MGEVNKATPDSLMPDLDESMYSRLTGQHHESMQLSGRTLPSNTDGRIPSSALTIWSDAFGPPDTLLIKGAHSASSISHAQLTTSLVAHAGGRAMLLIHGPAHRLACVCGKACALTSSNMDVMGIPIEVAAGSACHMKSSVLSSKLLQCWR